MGIDRGGGGDFETGIGHAIGVVLEFDMQLQRRSGIEGENLVQHRNAFPAAADEDQIVAFAGGQVGDGAGAVGGAVQRRVMDDQQFARLGQMHVEFDAFDRQIEQIGKTRKAVFGPEIAGAAMADDHGHSVFLERLRRPYLPLSTSPLVSQRCMNRTTKAGGTMTKKAALMVMFQLGA